ncbi:MAG: dihydroorotase [Rikenellaceae bacterium]
MKTLIQNGLIVNDGVSKRGDIIIEDDIIKSVIESGSAECDTTQCFDKIIDAKGAYVMAGVIDDQVHFRDPGLTYKATIASESRAGLSGGVTSFMEMPNTSPATTTLELLAEKQQKASEDSYSNYSFYLGATNQNIDQIVNLDPTRVCGVKVFMGSSTGNMLVDDKDALAHIFKSSPVLVATHCEKEEVIKANIAEFSAKYGENITPSMHPLIRSAEACYRSSAEAVELAQKHGGRLHVLHLSSAKEMSLFSEAKLTKDKKITAEVCAHHLWFDDRDYASKGNMIKWNPSIKSEADKLGLIAGLIEGRIDVVATDHAPHTIEEKSRPYLAAPSGGPLLSHSLIAMLELVERGVFSVEMVVEKMAHAPAKLFNIQKRGYIKEGYFADIAIVQKCEPWMVEKSNILYKCGWSPFEGDYFSHKVTHTLVNGVVAYENGVINEQSRGRELRFER